MTQQLGLIPNRARLANPDKKARDPLSERASANRSGGIRTHDPYYPKVVRYQAALRPDIEP